MNVKSLLIASLIIQAIALSEAGAGTRVAILDTGIVPNLPAFRGRIPVASDRTITRRKLGACSDLKDIQDDQGHGTAVTGIIAELSPSAELLPIRFNGAQEPPSEAKMICAVDLAIRLNARVLNVSYGRTKSTAALENAFRRASDAGILIIAAAGNEVVDRDQTPIYPANYQLPHLISVAAVDSKGQFLSLFPDSWESGSSYGAKTIDIAAPGELIKVFGLDGRRTQMSGTSFSTAHVSAIAAEILNREPHLNASDVKKRILAAALPLKSSSRWNTGPYVRSGYVKFSSF